MAKDTTKTEEAPRLKYEVMVDQITLGECLCARTAEVFLTAAQADALNAAQPGTLKLLGI